MEEASSELWAKFRSGDRGAYDSLVDIYLPLVKVTVGRMAMNYPRFIDQEELHSAGCVGLLSALEHYDGSRDAKFSTYAITRIRGAVLDELRNHDSLGRVTRDRVTRIRRAEDSLRSQGTECEPTAIAAAAGLSEEEYTDALLGDRAARLISLSDMMDDGEHSLADLLAIKADAPGVSSMEDTEIIERVNQMLTDKERMLVALYYHEELTLKEIGAIMKVSESRISQLHTEMVTRIKKELKKIGIY